MWPNADVTPLPEMLDFIVMQMSKVNREKGYSYVQNVENCLQNFQTRQI